MTEGWAYDATGGAALARAGERYQLPYRPAAVFYSSSRVLIQSRMHI